MNTIKEYGKKSLIKRLFGNLNKKGYIQIKTGIRLSECDLHCEEE